MTVATRARELIERARRRPGVVALARLASPAAYVEPELLRALRLAVTPALDAGVEADLWFSPLVSSRGPDGMVLDAGVAAELRSQLEVRWRNPRRRRRLRRARRVMARVHRDLSPALALEERIAWLAIAGDRAGIERELERVVAALAGGDRPGLREWIARAWDQLPRLARETRAGWLLRQAAGPAAGRRRLRPAPPPEGLHGLDLAAVLAGVPDVKLGVRRTGDLIEIGEIEGLGAAAILVPDTEPRPLELEWGDEPIPAGDDDVDETEDTRGSEALEVPAGGTVSRQVGEGPVRLRTARGAVYELASQLPSPAEPPVVYLAHALEGGRARPLKATLEEMLEGQGLAVSISGEDLRTGEGWRQELYRRLATCDGALVVLYGSEEVSPYLLRELTILNWRRSLEPEFKLVIVASSDSLSQPSLAPLGLAELQTVEIEDLGMLEQPEVRARIVGGFGRLQAASRDVRALHRVAAESAGLLEAVPAEVVERTRTLQDFDVAAIDLNDAGGGSRFSLASHLVREIPNYGLEVLLRPVNSLVPYLDPGSTRRLIDVLAPLWVPPQAAAQIRAASQRPPGERGFTLVCEYNETVEMYLRRAFLGERPLVLVPDLGPDEWAQDIQRKLRRLLEETLAGGGPISFPPLLKRLRARTRRVPVYVIIEEDLGGTSQAVSRIYPDLTVVVRTPPDGPRVEQFEVIEPQLSPEEEERNLWAIERMRDMDEPQP